MEPKEIFKLCDLRVGYVEECTILEGFNDIYSLVIALGEENKRHIGTGLRNHVPIEKIKNTKIVVFSNLKPKKFGKDFESNGMILTASAKDGDSKVYELIRPDESDNITYETSVDCDSVLIDSLYDSSYHHEGDENETDIENFVYNFVNIRFVRIN